jgi:SAM-dependent methyltransferase
MNDPRRSLKPVDESRETPGFLKRLVPAWARPGMTINIDETYLHAIDALPPGSRILNLGSGQQLWDRRIRHRMLNLDLDIHRGRTDICGDGHRLPFRDGSLDAVFSNAVLEHVRKPWEVAREIRRVLRPGGLVSINVPFLNVIHDVVDYHRFTADGLRVLFEGFQEVAAGVSAGPSSFFTVFMPEYACQFAPGSLLKRLVRLGLRMVLWPIKYLDLLIRGSSRLHLVADAFYFVGRRPDSTGP